MSGDKKNSQDLQAEFDLLADEYYEQHKSNVALTGEAPEYFAEYKIADLALLVRDANLNAEQILDFGCGIGNSIPFFRKYFAQSELRYCDISSRSLEIAQLRFLQNIKPKNQEDYVLLGRNIPLPSHSQDIVFSACVFHHIPQDEHQHWLSELHRVTRPGGLLVIYEHNPLNPLTLHAVNTCPLDMNARLIRAGILKRRILAGGWKQAQLDYRLFFPAMFKSLRPLERYLGWLWLGAQYRITAYKAS